MNTCCNWGINRSVPGERQHLVRIEQAEQPGQHRDDAAHQQQVVNESGVQIGGNRSGKQTSEQILPLRGQVGAGFA